MHKVHMRAVLPGHREHNFLLIQAFLHSKGEPRTPASCSSDAPDAPIPPFAGPVSISEVQTAAAGREET